MGNDKTGYCNTGNYNTGNYNTGDCNTGTPTVRLFNKDSGLDFFCDTHVRFRNIISKYSTPLCEWVSESNMGDDEKENYSSYKTTGGYLKVSDMNFNSKDISSEDAELLRGLPNFDADILLECTELEKEGHGIMKSAMAELDRANDIVEDVRDLFTFFTNSDEDKLQMKEIYSDIKEYTESCEDEEEEETAIDCSGVDFSSIKKGMIDASMPTSLKEAMIKMGEDITIKMSIDPDFLKDCKKL